MSHPNTRRVTVAIYPNQLTWIEEIGRVMNKPKRQVILECFSEYIGGFKHTLKSEAICDERHV
jgi:hypothetical protein